MEITISLDDDEIKLLNKRAKKNLLTLKEQVQDIIRRSCISAKETPSGYEPKIDDKLVEIFSRHKKGKRKITF